MDGECLWCNLLATMEDNMRALFSRPASGEDEEELNEPVLVGEGV